MKFCPNHWQQLRDAIEAHGLTPLVSKSGSEMMGKFVAAMKGSERFTDFDPLMRAHNAIVNNAVKGAGPQILMGDHCPICYLNEAARQHTGRCADPACKVKPEYENWIRFAADETKEVYSKWIAEMKSGEALQ